MPPDITTSIQVLRDATSRLEAAVDATIANGGHDAFAAPSLLPNWTIGHVVSHLARNADGLHRVLVGAKVGEQLQPYASPQARVDDIEAGAKRSTEAIATDFRAATGQLMEIIDEIGPAVWSFTVDLGRGGQTTADVVPAMRLGEVEIHHHDLGVDAGLGLLTEQQAARLLAALLRSYVRTRDVPAMTLAPIGADDIVVRGGGTRVAGSAVDLAGWLAGRADGATLTAAGGLPALPNW